MIGKRDWVFVIAITWVLAGVAVLLIYLSSQNWNWNWTTDWNTLAAFATWVLAGGVFFAVWQIIVARENTNKQLEAARRITSAQVAVELFKELREEVVVNTLRTIYNLEPNDLKQQLENNMDLKHGIEEVVDNLELLAALVAQGIFDEKTAIEAYSGSTALRCWYVLHKYIKRVRDERSGLYCKYLEDFAARTFEYQSSHPEKKDEWIKFRRGEHGRKIDLIQHLIDHPNLQPKRRT